MRHDDDLMAGIEEGNRLLMEGRADLARMAYQEVWRIACDEGDHYSACAAAHMLGAMPSMPPDDRLRWHLASLEHARQVSDGRVDGWYASIYLNIGHSYLLLGRQEKAVAYFAEGLRTSDKSPYAQAVRVEIEKAMAEMNPAEHGTKD